MGRTARPGSVAAVSGSQRFRGGSFHLHIITNGYFDTVPATTLGAVESRVSSTDQHFGILHDTTRCDSRAQGNRDSAFGQHNGVLADGQEEPLCQGYGSHGVAVGQDKEELLPAIATDTIVRAYGIPHTASRLAQHGVTRQVPVGIVDVFEVIEIRQHHADRCISVRNPLGAVQFVLERFQHRSACAQLRQRVLSGLLTDDLAGSYELVPQVEDTPAQHAGACGVPGHRRAW